MATLESFFPQRGQTISEKQCTVALSDLPLSFGIEFGPEINYNCSDRSGAEGQRICFIL